MSKEIAAIRKEYRLKMLREEEVEREPIRQFDKWWTEACKSELPEVNAMTLATVSGDGIPSARIVLLKGFNESGFVFFTNYHSAKAQHLTENPYACLVFFWPDLERQVRITGKVEPLDSTASDEYFNSRPLGSRLGAIASPQSQVISSREWLEQRVAAVTREWEDRAPERPQQWGGYLVRPFRIEFWQGRPDRLHDRIQYLQNDNKGWEIARLAP